MAKTVAITLTNDTGWHKQPFTLEEIEFCLEDGYFNEFNTELSVLDAMEFLLTDGYTKRVYLERSEENPMGYPMPEVVLVNEYTTPGGTTYVDTIRGNIELLDALLLARTEQVEFVCGDWHTHFIIRSGLASLKYWAKETWDDVSVSFAYRQDEYSNDQTLYQDEYDEYATDSDKEECCIVHPGGCAFPPLYIGGGNVEDWYYGVGDNPPDPFIWKFDDMLPEEAKEIQESEDYTWCDGGVWVDTWGGWSPDPSQVIIKVGPKEETDSDE